MCPSFPFGIEGGMWDVIVLIPFHCLSIYFSDKKDDLPLVTAYGVYVSHLVPCALACYK